MASPPEITDALQTCTTVPLERNPANDTVPCRLDVVLRAAQVRRLSIDGIERLLCGIGPAAPLEGIDERRQGNLARRAPVG